MYNMAEKSLKKLNQLDRSVTDFLEYLEVDRGLSPQTLQYLV
jgi:hypothetical protein